MCGVGGFRKREWGSEHTHFAHTVLQAEDTVSDLHYKRIDKQGIGYNMVIYS